MKVKVYFLLLLMVSNVEKASGLYGGAGMAGWLYGGRGQGRRD